MKAWARRLALVGLTALPITLLTAAPALAAASPGQSNSVSESADHVDPSACDAITFVDGQLIVNGTPLTTEQANHLVGLGTDIGLELAALAVTADDADVCIDVGGLPGLPVVNGHFAWCGAVAVDADVRTNPNAVVNVGGVSLRNRYRTVDTVDAFDVAGAAGIPACVTGRIDDNTFILDVEPSEAVCVSVTVQDDMTLDAAIGGTADTVLLGEGVGGLTLVDPDALLDTEEAVEVVIELAATVDYLLHASAMVVTVTGPGTCPPVAEATPPLLPNTAVPATPDGPDVLIPLVTTMAIALGVTARRRQRPARPDGGDR